MTKFSCWYQFDQTRGGFSQSWLIWSLTTFHTCYNYMCRSYLPFCQWNTDYFKPNTYSPLSPRLPSRPHSCVWSPLQPGVTNVSRAGDYSGLGCVGENHQYCNMRLETLRPTTAARIIRDGNISDSHQIGALPQSRIERKDIIQQAQITSHVFKTLSPIWVLIQVLKVVFLKIKTSVLCLFRFQ